MPRFTVALLTATPDGLTPDGGAWTKIDGREAVLRTVELFLNRDPITQLLLVVSREESDEAKRKFGAHLSFSGVKLITGGATWADQLKDAAPLVSGESTHVLLHDAARPAVPYGDIDRLIDIADKHPAVALSAPLRSATVRTGESPEMFPAGSLQLLLLPMAMERKVFVDLAADGQMPSADGLTFLPGSGLNQRVSGQSDASLVKAMIGLLPKPKLKAPSNPFEEAQW